MKNIIAAIIIALAIGGHAVVVTRADTVRIDGTVNIEDINDPCYTAPGERLPRPDGPCGPNYTP